MLFSGMTGFGNMMQGIDCYHIYDIEFFQRINMKLFITCLLYVTATKNTPNIKCFESKMAYWHLIIGSANFSVKGQIVNSLGFVSHMVSVATTQFCSCSSKTAMDNM